MNPFENIVGHEEEISRLRQLVTSQKTPHGLLFWGEEGIGKFKLAKAFAKQILSMNESVSEMKRTFDRVENGNHPDYFVLKLEEGKSEISVAQIEEINQSCRMLAEKKDGKKVYIIDQAECMNDFASNRFLKTLEEPPQNVIFILVSSHKNAISPTILSRCQHLFFKPLELNLVSTILSLHYHGKMEKPAEEVRNSAIYLSYGKPGRAVYLIDHHFEKVFDGLNSFLKLGSPSQFDDLLRTLELYMNQVGEGTTKNLQQRSGFLAFLEITALYFREFVVDNPKRAMECKTWGLKNYDSLLIDSKVILNIMDLIERYTRNLQANGHIGILSYSFCMAISKTWNSQFLQMK